MFSDLSGPQPELGAESYDFISNLQHMWEYVLTLPTERNEIYASKVRTSVYITSHTRAKESTL